MHWRPPKNVPGMFRFSTLPLTRAKVDPNGVVTVPDSVVDDS